MTQISYQYDSFKWLLNNTFNESVITANIPEKTKITEQTDGCKKCLYHQNDLFSVTACML